jgi:hypothetical protein
MLQTCHHAICPQIAVDIEDTVLKLNHEHEIFYLIICTLR